MSAAIRVSQLSLETPVTSEIANILTSTSESIQTIDEVISSVSAVRVTAISLEIPLSQVVVETITNVGTSEQTILEEITGTPVVEQTAGGAVPSAWVGGASVNRESLISVSRSEQMIDELISEDIVTSATSIQNIETVVQEKRVFSTPPKVKKTPTIAELSEVVKFETTREREHVLVSDQPELVERRRQREEDELILLGVLG